MQSQGLVLWASHRASGSYDNRGTVPTSGSIVCSCAFCDRIVHISRVVVGLLRRVLRDDGQDVVEYTVMLAAIVQC
jgi:hypothetical protein